MLDAGHALDHRLVRSDVGVVARPVNRRLGIGIEQRQRRLAVAGDDAIGLLLECAQQNAADDHEADHGQPEPGCERRREPAGEQRHGCQEQRQVVRLLHHEAQRRQ